MGIVSLYGGCMGGAGIARRVHKGLQETIALGHVWGMYGGLQVGGGVYGRLHAGCVGGLTKEHRGLQ